MPTMILWNRRCKSIECTYMRSATPLFAKTEIEPLARHESYTSFTKATAVIHEILLADLGSRSFFPRSCTFPVAADPG